MVGRKLRAVRPVDLVAVVLLGVVAGRHVQTGGAAVVPNGKAQLRGGTKGIENTDMDAVGGHDRSGLFRKGATVEAAVVGDGDALGLGLLALGGDHIGEGLGGMADHIGIHVVQAHLHGAAQTGGAELQRCIEAAFDLFLVILDGVQFLPLLFAESGTVKPALKLFLIVPHCFPPHIIAWRQAEDFPVRRYPFHSR